MSEPTGARRYGTGGGDAYYDAVKYGGYEGTREQFGKDQAEFAKNATAVAEAKEMVEQDTEEVRSTKETFVNTTVPDAIAAVQQEGADQVQVVTQQGEESSQQVETVGTQWKDEVANEGRARVQAVEQAGTDQVQAVEDAGTAQVGAVNQAGEDQVDAVEQAGADQVQAVTDEGTTQVGAVTGEGDTQVQRVQDKGDEVIASIPEDYSNLLKDVADLSSVVVNGNLNQKIKINPFVMRTTADKYGTIRNNRSTITVNQDGTLKATPITSGSDKTAGLYTEISNDSADERIIFVSISGLITTRSDFSTWSLFVSQHGTTITDTVTRFTDSHIEIIFDLNSLTESDIQINLLEHGSLYNSDSTYFTVESMQYVDLTEMFGSGHEPSLDVFKSVYGSQMPYAYRIPGSTEDLREEIALIKECKANIETEISNLNDKMLRGNVKQVDFNSDGSILETFRSNEKRKTEFLGDTITETYMTENNVVISTVVTQFAGNEITINY